MNTAVQPAKQFIILKADDLVYDDKQVNSPKWRKFIDYVESEKIKASIGIIGNSLDKGKQPYFDEIQAIHERGILNFGTMASRIRSVPINRSFIIRAMVTITIKTSRKFIRSLSFLCSHSLILPT